MCVIYLAVILITLQVYIRGSSSMATSISVCAVCDLQHQTTQSTHWCIECEEPLCSDCKQHHNVLKATKIHKTIPFTDYQLLPSVVTDIKHNCVYHNEMYQLYCNKHESPICNKCVKDHSTCGKILSLDEIVRDIKTTESFIDLEQSLEDLLTNIIQIRKDRESNIDRIKDQKKKITEQVSHIKKQVIQHVNKLEEEFIKELDQIEFDCCVPIHSCMSLLLDKAKQINQMKSEFQTSKKYASELQAFLHMSAVQAKALHHEKHLQSIIENKNFEEISIESTTNNKIQDFLTVDIFGSINVKENPSTNIDLNRRKDRQAQILVPKVNKVFNNVKLKLIRKLKPSFKHIYGCCVTKKAEFLFTNYERDKDKLIAINADGEVIYTIPLNEPYGAYDVAYMGDSTVAISTGYSDTKPGISIVDLTKRKVMKFIGLPGFPYGISYNGESLICCVEDEDLHVISCTDYKITTIFDTVLPECSYVSNHADMIFSAHIVSQTVTCCTYSGTTIWEFKDENVLDRPRGITVDNNGNVFVVGVKSCNVVVISPDGKQGKQILTKEDGLKSPTAISFDKVKNLLLVTNENRFVNIYDVSYT